jgi:hypothetical protein
MSGTTLDESASAGHERRTGGLSCDAAVVTSVAAAIRFVGVCRRHDDYTG